jgi:hypothetical protein
MRFKVASAFLENLSEKDLICFKNLLKSKDYCAQIPIRTGTNFLNLIYPCFIFLSFSSLLQRTYYAERSFSGYVEHANQNTLKHSELLLWL